MKGPTPPVVVTVAVYAVPTVPWGKVAVLKVTPPFPPPPAALTLIDVESVIVVVPSLAEIVTEGDSTTVGRPVMKPVLESNVTPVGNRPLVMENVIGPAALAVSNVAA